MAQEDAKSMASLVWEQLKCKDSAMRSKVEAVLQRAYGRGDEKKTSPKRKAPPEWMVSLGMVKRKKNAEKPADGTKEEKPVPNVDKEERREAAAAALAAVKSGATVRKDPLAGSAAAPVEEETPPTKPAEAGPSSEKRSATGIDGILEQIQKKQKINVLDKSKQDWGEFKDEKGFQEELEAYKKSGDKYLEKVAFLQRADLREYEKERDARLAYQSKRKQNVNYQED